MMTMDSDRFEWVCKQRIKRSLKATLFYLAGSADRIGVCRSSISDIAFATCNSIHQTQANINQLYLHGLIRVLVHTDKKGNEIGKDYILNQSKFIKDENAPKKIVKI